MKYTVTKAVQLPTGTLVKFNDAQAKRRSGLIANVKGKQYECLVPVWVKAGETVDIDAPAKHLLACLEAQSGKPNKPDTPQPAAAPAPESSGAGDEDTANAAPSESDPAAE